MAVYVIVWSDLPAGKLLQFGLTLLSTLLAHGALGEIDTDHAWPSAAATFARRTITRETGLIFRRCSGPRRRERK